MKTQPGSFFWLVAHDLRLGARRVGSMFGKASPVVVIAILGAAIGAFHLLAIPVANWFGAMAGGDPSQPLFYPALASGVLLVLPWLVSQGLTGATRALYSRGDLDLLLASPLDARKVVAARALAIAVESLLSVAIFVLPLVNANVLQGRWHWLAVYPGLAAASLGATAIGLLVAVGLFRVAGPRKTRVISQVAATFIAAAFVLGLQLVNILPAEMRDNLMNAIEASDRGGIFDRAGLLWLPVRAIAGDLSALIWWCGASIALFAAVAWACGPAFAASALRAGSGAAVVRARRSRKALRFHGGVGFALRRKEWRLLVRDPWLISQILLQVIYTLPVAIVVWRSQGPDGNVALSIAPAVVVIASQIASSLAWITVSGEDAPDFIATAPVTRQAVERGKLQAIGLPLACFLVLPLVGIALASVSTALLTLLFAIGAAMSTSLLNLWNPAPGKRGDMMRRHSQSKLVAIVEHLLSLCWAVAMVLAALGSWAVLVPLVLVGVILWFNRPGRSKPAPRSIAPLQQSWADASH